MPRAAIELGAVDRVVAIDDMAAAISEMVAQAPAG
jgi:chemotaxis response regulator CheB